MTPFVLAAKIAAWSQVCGPFHKEPDFKPLTGVWTIGSEKICPCRTPGVQLTNGFYTLDDHSVECLECRLKLAKEKAIEDKKILDANEKCRRLEQDAVKAFHELQKESGK